MIVLISGKWYQTFRLVMTRRLVTSVTFLCQVFKLTYLGHYVGTMLFATIYGDLNIDLTQKKFRKGWRSLNELSNVVCRLSLQFVAFEI